MGDLLSKIVTPDYYDQEVLPTILRGTRNRVDCLASAFITIKDIEKGRLNTQPDTIYPHSGGLFKYLNNVSPREALQYFRMMRLSGKVLIWEQELINKIIGVESPVVIYDIAKILSLHSAELLGDVRQVDVIKFMKNKLGSTESKGVFESVWPEDLKNIDNLGNYIRQVEAFRGLQLILGGDEYDEKKNIITDPQRLMYNECGIPGYQRVGQILESNVRAVIPLGVGEIAWYRDILSGTDKG